jgi:hypothetical protein
MNWRKTSKPPEKTGRFFVKGKDGVMAVFAYTNSALSKILLRDQYEFWLDESDESLPTDEQLQAEARERYPARLQTRPTG